MIEAFYEIQNELTGETQIKKTLITTNQTLERRLTCIQARLYSTYPRYKIIRVVSQPRFGTVADVLGLS